MTEGSASRTMRAFAFALGAGFRFPVPYLAAVVGWGAVTALPLASAWVLGRTVEAIASTPFDGPRVLGFAALFTVLELVRVSVIYAALDVDHRHRFLVSSVLRVNLVRRAMRPPAARNGVTPGDVVDRTRSDVQSTENAMSEIGDLVSQTLFLAGALIIMSSLSWSAAVGGVAVVLVVVLLATVIGPVLEDRIGRQRNADADYVAMLGPVLEHRSALRRAGSESGVRAHLSRLAAERGRRNVARQAFALSLSNASAVAPYIGIGVFLLLGSGSLSGDAVALGQVVTAIYLFLFLSDSAVTFASYVDYIRATRVALDRADTMFDGQAAALWTRPVPGVRTVTGGPGGVTDAEHGPGQGGPASSGWLERLPIPVERGRVTAVLGSTGSGKTTLLRDCLDVWDQETERTNGSSLGYLPQNPILMNTTVRESVLVDREENATALQNALHRSRLEADIAGWPDGIEKPVGPGGTGISGGQRQRVTLAQAIYAAPTVLVLDEPFSALDGTTAAELTDELLGPGRASPTVLIATSRTSIAERADTVLLVEEGRVVDSGPPGEVLARSIPSD